jgi:glyoxylate reductase
MANVFVTRVMPGDAVERLGNYGHAVRTWPEALPPSPEALGAELSEADAALTTVVDRISPGMLVLAPQLRVVANMAVGYDNIDPASAAELGVWVTNTPGVLAETTADFAWALLMAAARNVVAGDRDARAGGWQTWSPTGFLGTDVHGATLGIVGLGQIGEAVARRAAGFGMRVLYASKSRKPGLEASIGCEPASLDDLLRVADFVSLHTPLNAETRGLIGARELALMKPSAILVNTARGQVIDQEALVEALRARTLAGAALDVADPEPLPAGHALYGFENVIITPHIASASLATRSRMAAMAADNIIAVLEGREPPHPVNHPALPRAVT